MQFSWWTLDATLFTKASEKDKATCSLNRLISFISASQFRFIWHRHGTFKCSQAHYINERNFQNSFCNCILSLSWAPDEDERKLSPFLNYRRGKYVKFAPGHHSRNWRVDSGFKTSEHCVTMLQCQKWHYRDIIFKTVMFLSDCVSRPLNSLCTCLQGSVKEGGLQLHASDILAWDQWVLSSSLLLGLVPVCHSLQSVWLHINS